MLYIMGNSSENAGKSTITIYNSRFIAGEIMKLNDGFSSHVRLLEGYPLPISFSPPLENHGGCRE